MSTLTMSQLSGMNLHYAHHSLEYFLDRQVELGIENVEIWGASPHLLVEDATPERIHYVRKAVKQRGLNLVCYTPETVLYPINIAAEEEYIRRRSLRDLSRAIEITAELEVDKMLLTPGWGYVERDKSASLGYSLQSIEILTRKAEREGITLALEHLSPISSNLINTAADLKMVLDHVSSPHLKAMLDTCQVGLVNEHVRDYFQALGEDLIHIHIVDGTPGGHLAFGDGNLPLEDFVRTIGDWNYKGYLSMEISDRRYFQQPELADKQSIDLFRQWIQA